MKILIAEDDPLLRTALVRVLERMGHHITAVCDGREALEATVGDTFDLVVSDHDMPHMTGLDLHEALPEHMRRRFLLHSGNHAVLAQVEGRVRTLLKGLSSNEFRDAIEEALAAGGAIA